MKKSTKASKTTTRTSGGMLMNSSTSSNDSHSEDDKCHLPTADLILSDAEPPTVVIRRNVSRLRRQQATSSLQSSLSVRNTSSFESIDNDDDDGHVITSDQISFQTNPHEQTANRTSFNDSERTDSGIGRDSGSSWRLSNYSDSLCYPSKQQQTEYDEHSTTPIPRVDSSGDSREQGKLQKAGWLHVKHWLTVQRHRKIDLASKRHWKRFWTCLKGSNLYLYHDYTDTQPKLTISIVESLCYPLPEHPHRQHVFSLTTRFGDTFCVQASDQSELDHWIRNVHGQCVSKSSELTVRNAIREIERDIEREKKMRKLGDLQLKSSAGQKVRSLISKQIEQWEKNLEAYHADLFRNKCYLCALTNERELPNPKDLLAQACPATKAALHKLAAFTPCSFYALTTSRRRADRSSLKSKTLPNDQQETKCYLTLPSTPLSSTVGEQTILQMVTCQSNPQMRTIVSITTTTTVGELLKRVTEKLCLQSDDYFLYFDTASANGFIPEGNTKLKELVYTSVEIRRKLVYQVTLHQELVSSGIDIDTELYREYSLQVIVSKVKRDSEGERAGIRKGDEIVMINNSIVQDLDLHTLDRSLSRSPIVLTLRSARSTDSMDDLHRSLDLSHTIIQHLICPPPPRRIERLSRQEIRELVVPKPDLSCPNEKLTSTNGKESKDIDPSTSALERLFKNVDELSRYCRPLTTLSGPETEEVSPIIHPIPRIKSLSNAQRIRKVIFELLETERSYVQDMQRLLERYIEPLRDDSKLLPTDVIESLYVSVKSIHQLQQTFLERLESNIPTEILAYNAVHEFRDILVSIGETFLSYSQYFKLYSTFCAMHLRINRLLDMHQNNQHLKDFLAARNPRHQHSSSFESYLIKPVQRILKYPLLLQQLSLYSNTNGDHPHQVLVPLEIVKLKEAITMMNEMGEYMNGMQQLYEDFGQSFEQIIKSYSEDRKKTLQLNLPDLCAYGEIDWLNLHQFLLGKHQQRLKSYCFVFRHGCLLIVREPSNKKKQDHLSNHKGNKTNSDRLIRFIPIEELSVEWIENENSKENIRTWQLIQSDTKTRLKTDFRFSNKDAQTFVQTIDNCISSRAATTFEWRANPTERTATTIRKSEPPFASQISTQPPRLSTSRSFHVLLPSKSHLNTDHPRRSPSPIWKRRTTPVRKPAIPTNVRRKTMRNSTDC